MASRRRRRRRKQKEPLTLSGVIAALRPIKPKSPERLPPIAQWRWRQIVGETLAERAQPTGLKAGVLWLVVHSSAWAQELSFLEADLIRRLREAQIPVRKIRVFVGQVPKLARLPRHQHPRRRQPLRRLPAGLEEKFEGLEDDELAEAMSRAAQIQLGRLGRFGPGESKGS